MRWFVFELTDKCNLKCEYCYNVWLEDKSLPKKPLTLENITSIIKNISSASETAGITLTGGEPLLREDLPEIVSICISHKLKVSIATNGYLLTQALINKLTARGVEHFDIGFSTPTIEGKAAITRAAQSGKTVTASVCISRSNYKEIRNIVRIASAMGANAVALNRFIPTGRGFLNKEKLSLNSDELIQLLSDVNSIAKKVGIYCFTGIPVEPCIREGYDLSSIQFSTCQCGKSKWLIDPEGNLRTCEQNKQLLGNLMTEPFESIIKTRFKEIEQFRSWRPSDKCVTCSIQEKCFGGCRFDSSISFKATIK